MSRRAVTDARVRALRPRKRPYDVRDPRLKGFGVKVLPSGRKRYFIQCQHRGDRIWKIVGDPEAMTAGEARFRADEMLTSIRRGEGPPFKPEETVFETVAETVFERYSRIWNGPLEASWPPAAA